MIKAKVNIKYPIKTGYRFIDENKQHLHALNEKALIGTTTATHEVLKPPLAWYGSGKAVELFGVTDAKVLTKIRNGTSTKEERELLAQGLIDALDRIKGMNTQLYRALVDKAYRNHADYSDTKKEEGTELHDTLETYIKHCIETNGGMPMAFATKDERIDKWIDWAMENVVEFLHSECYCYSEKLWLGGKFDVIFKAKDKKTYLGDFKSSKASFHEHWVQMALYDMQIMENGVLSKEGDVLAPAPVIEGYALFPFGGNVTPDYRYNMQDYWKAGEGVLANYKLINS